MKRHLPGLITLLVASVLLGILVGNVFFGLFNRAVPSAVLTDLSHWWTRATFLTYGAGFGIVLFLWGLLAIAGAKIFARFRRGSTSTGT